ncbi:N-6 DNA methylase [Corynebacterium sp. MSK035]|uniref:HsdM family class I SAM-dependent methyltransferase n=4 Tax=Corynebacterium TaxID=1716 RepID=UPI0025501D71|nr:N-6 DNA methylase [Corynebacterium sp. MSK035]MCT1370194.1 N-6 DNA methylase [Corynebacterium mucifaciens]MDK8809769.1 N-6 DNA methylase [Corynebacterium sp. MSK035]
MAYVGEDEVRNAAGLVLGFDEKEAEVQQGFGQLLPFSRLGFEKVQDKPDGWYLPDNTAMPAIIAEFKGTHHSLDNEEWVAELKKNVDIVLTKYEQCIGILYNREDIRVFLNNVELESVAKELQHKSYYLRLATNKPIDKRLIYTLTSRINNTLHFNFGVKNLYSRMVFTACALVALRENAWIAPGMNYDNFHNSILNQLNKSLEKHIAKNAKLTLLASEFSKVETAFVGNQKSIDDFIGWLKEISGLLNSDNWAGEDVMAIFFNEFNRYKTKSEQGQVFTPDHITGFMARLVDLNEDDKVLDAACGSGAFLVKAMNIMIEKSGGIGSNKEVSIKQKQLFGIEKDKEIFALAAANMLLHKDGKTNLALLDSRYEDAGDWIKSKPITKVLMNPPYERKYGCMKIVKNVLDNVERGTICAFILPDKKLDRDGGKTLLKKHRLEKVIKLPTNTFMGIGQTTSIFIFTAKEPQDGREIFACNIEDDGLITVKNQGRQDVLNRWPAIEDKWIEIIRKQSGHPSIQWLDPNKHLSWQEPDAPFQVTEDDFFKKLTDYEVYQRGIDASEFAAALSYAVIYRSDTSVDGDEVLIRISDDGEEV